MKKTNYKIEGMDCAACAKMIELDLEDAGIIASCDYAKQILEVPGNHNPKKVKEIVQKAGYSVQ